MLVVLVIVGFGVGAAIFSSLSDNSNSKLDDFPRRP